MSTRELLIKRYCDELPGLRAHLKDPWLLDQCDYLARKVLLYSKFREEVLASLNELALDRGTHERLEMGFNACLEIGVLIGSLREILVAGDWALKGEKAEFNEQRTILAANAQRSADAARKWFPHQQEFQRLVSGGMKPDRARTEILGDWTEGDNPPSMKTARKWLRLDGEAD